MRMYLLILRRNQAEPLSVPQEEMFVRFQRFTESLEEKGALRSFERLKPSAEGTTVREHGGVIALEGLYDRAQDGVIGFYLIEVADQEAAHALAKECPILLAGGSVEIRETEVFRGQAAREDAPCQGEAPSRGRPGLGTVLRTFLKTLQAARPGVTATLSAVELAGDLLDVTREIEEALAGAGKHGPRLVHLPFALILKIMEEPSGSPDGPGRSLGRDGQLT